MFNNTFSKPEPTEAYSTEGGGTTIGEATGTPDDQTGEPIAFGTGEKSSVAAEGEKMP